MGTIATNPRKQIMLTELKNAIANKDRNASHAYALALESRVKSYSGFHSSYDNGWSRGFIFRPLIEGEDGDLPYVVIDIHYEGGAGHEEVTEYDNVCDAMKHLANNLCLEIAHQNTGNEPNMVF